MATVFDNLLSTDVYDIADAVNTVKKQYVDEDEQTLSMGLYGYIGSLETAKMQMNIQMASELTNEIFPNRAKYDKNVITHAIMHDIDDIYATPASLTAIICIKSDDLEKYSDDDGRFVIDHKCIFSIDNGVEENLESYEFHPYYDIILSKVTINQTETVYTARYDVSIANNLSDITNPYLNAPVTMEYGGESYIGVQVDLYQVTLTTVQNKLVTSNLIDNKTFIFEHDDQLADFTIEAVDDGVSTMLTPIYEGGVAPTDGKYCYYILLDDTKVRVKFERTSYSPTINTEINVNMQTTKGAEGNFTYGASAIFATLTSDTYSYSNITSLVWIQTESANGLDAKSADELRAIIPKEALARGAITTEADLNNYFNQLNDDDNMIKLDKKVDNQVEHTYYSHLLIKDEDSNMIPTNTIKLLTRVCDYPISANGRYVIPAGAIIKYDSRLGYGVLIHNDITEDGLEDLADKDPDEIVDVTGQDTSGGDVSEGEDKTYTVEDDIGNTDSSGDGDTDNDGTDESETNSNTNDNSNATDTEESIGNGGEDGELNEVKENSSSEDNENEKDSGGSESDQDNSEGELSSENSEEEAEVVEDESSTGSSETGDSDNSDEVSNEDAGIAVASLDEDEYPVEDETAEEETTTVPSSSIKADDPDLEPELKEINDNALESIAELSASDEEDDEAETRLESGVSDYDVSGENVDTENPPTQTSKGEDYDAIVLTDGAEGTGGEGSEAEFTENDLQVENPTYKVVDNISQVEPVYDTNVLDFMYLVTDEKDFEVDLSDKKVFYYTNPYTIIVNAGDRQYASYYLCVIDENKYMNYKYINQDSDVQFICNYISWSRNFITDSNTYKLNMVIYQNIQEDMGLYAEEEVTVDDETTTVVTAMKVKVFLVLYRNDSPYRYAEGVFQSFDDEDYDFIFQITMDTKNIILDTDNNIRIENLGIAGQTESDYGYFEGNTSACLYVLIEDGGGAGRYDLDDIIPGLDNYSVTNMFEINDGLDFFVNYSGIMSSKLEVVPADETMNEAYRLTSLPVVGYQYALDEDRMDYFISQLNYKKAYIDNANEKIYNPFGVDFKFYNTYGPSEKFTTDGETKIDRVNIQMNFELKLKSSYDVNTVDYIKDYVKNTIVEDLNGEASLHIPNLITDVTTKYRESIEYFEFKGIDDYGPGVQHLYHSDTDYVDMVPEFININMIYNEDGTMTPDININVV